MPPSKNISFDELSKFFHLPINQVAKELGVCATILKKICRKNGIPRWPHRKIKSLDKMISNLNTNLEKNPNEREDIAREIELLRTKKVEIMKNPDILVQKNNGTDYQSRALVPKMKNKSSVKSAPYPVKMKEEGEVNCFAPTEKKTYAAATYILQEKPVEVPKPALTPLKIEPQNSVEYSQPQQSPQTPQQNFYGMVAPVASPAPQSPYPHNFYFPPLASEIQPNAQQSDFPMAIKLPELRFPEPKSYSMMDNHMLPSVPRNSAFTPAKNLFPDWFNQERDRVLGRQ